MAKQSAITGAELTVLQTLWEMNGGTVRAVADQLESEGNDWAYTTVQTLLNRLETKGAVARDMSRAAHVYRAAVSREDLLSQRLHDLADQYCDGASSPLVMALVNNHRFSPKEIAHFRQLLDTASKTAPRKSARKRGNKNEDAAR